MSAKPSPDLRQIAAQFHIPGEFIRADPYGHGHINDTYLAKFIQPDGTHQDYILQRINHTVFKNPTAVNQNIQAVTAHLCAKITAAGGDPKRQTLTMIPTRQNGYLHISADGTCWRAFHFIEDARTYQLPQNQTHVYHAGKAFGNFQHMLADFPATTLHETIPDFHHTPARFNAFQRAVRADPYRHAAAAAAEIDFVLQRAGEVTLVTDAIDRGEIPLRVPHNDTKFNNVMIDDHTGEAICIIDLDTVMPGSLLFDFGDGIRSIANTAEEDQPDLELVHFSLETFENFTRGYLEAIGESITPAEFALLPFSGRLLTLECGMRFLTDHLEGDIYFRTAREGHNLDRCRTQFKLLAEMEAQFAAIKQIVSRYAPSPDFLAAGFID